MRIAFIGIGNMGEPMAERLVAAGHSLVVHTRTRSRADAPVTGGVGGAKAGTLSLLVGGDSAAIERARTVLESLGTITHCDESGSGQRMKLVNQTIVAGIVTGLAEGLALARRGGLDADTVIHALGRGTAGGMLFNAYAKKMFDGETLGVQGLAAVYRTP